MCASVAMSHILYFGCHFSSEFYKFPKLFPYTHFLCVRACEHLCMMVVTSLDTLTALLELLCQINDIFEI